MQNKKVIVFGGVGFIGSHVVDKLIQSGYEVTICDIRRPSESAHKKLNYINVDILDYPSVCAAIDGHSFVYLFSGIADIAEARNNYINALRLNILGAINVFNACVGADVERILYASTMYVYSEHGSFYRASKQSAETILETFSKEFSLNYTILRYGSIYGPRSQGWNGLRRYVREILKTGRMTYWGDGSEKRDYIHVSDAAQMSVLVLNEKYVNMAVTITGQQSLNAKELIDLLFEVTGKNKVFEFTGNDMDHGHYIISPYRYNPKKAIKIVPTEFVDIGEGVLELVDDISKELNL